MRISKLGRVSCRYAACVCSLIALMALPHAAFSQQYHGQGLSTSLTFTLDFSAGESLLVRASQSHADYQLTLSDGDTQKVLHQVDISYELGLEEVMLVESGDCNQCQITLSASQAIDRNSAYSVTVEAISAPAKGTSEHASRLSLFSNLTLAGKYSASAKISSKTQRKHLLKLMVTHLDDASKDAVNSASTKWNYHALLLLEASLYQMGKRDQAKQNLLKIVGSAAGENLKFKAHALYLLAAYESDIDKERDMYQRGMQIALDSADQRLLALGSNYLGINLVRNGHLEEGIKLLERAYSIYQSSQRWRDLMEPMHNLSWAHRRYTNLPTSLAYATQLKLLADEVNDELNVLWALYDLAQVYRSKGDHDIALEFIDEALARHAIFESGTQPFPASLKGYLLQEKTKIFMQNGAWGLAADHADLVIEEFQQSVLANRLADALFFRGEISMAKGDFQAARQSYQNAINYDQLNNRDRSLGKRYLRLAELELIQGDFIAASTANNLALAKISKASNNYLKALAFSQTVEILHRLGAHNDADDLAKKTSAFILRHGEPEDLARFAYRRASVLHQLQLYPEAKGLLIEAKSIIVKALPKIRQVSLRRTYFALQKSVFELDIQLGLLRGPSGDRAINALALAESFKANSLEESLAIIRSDQHIQAAQRLRRQTILHKIQQNAVSWHSGSAANTSGLLSNTRALSYALEKLETEIEGYQEQHVIDAPSSLQILKPGDDELIAVYFTGQVQSWLWAISAQGTELYTLPSEQKITQLVSTLIADFSKAPALRSKANGWSNKQALQTLSSVVLQPLSAQLNASNINHLTIVPDGPLHGFPFAALHLNGQKEPLLATHSLAFAPSLSALKLLREASRSSSHRVTTSKQGKVRLPEIDALVVADPLLPDQAKLPLKQLPHTRQEAAVMASILGDSATILESAQAFKQGFLKHLNKPYSILHLATHGLLNSEEPALSGLVFSAVKADNYSNNIWLAPEISNSTLQVDLVVLSACESAIGKQIAGEGLMSLSRAFIEGGANNVIGTLWSVQDRVSASLVEEFYKSLLIDKASVARSLQRAQINTYNNQQNDWADPYYWAGLQLMGSGGGATL